MTCGIQEPPGMGERVVFHEIVVQEYIVEEIGLQEDRGRRMEGNLVTLCERANLQPRGLASK